MSKNNLEEKRVVEAHTPRLSAAEDSSASKPPEKIERVYRPHPSNTGQARTPPTGGSSVKPPRETASRQ
jgi:hypothetical protein